jgi:hypothetical protein
MIIDFHVELSSIIVYFNDQILKKQPLPFSGKSVYAIAQQVYISADLRPFLVKPTNVNTSLPTNQYYQKYVRLAKDWHYETIPDFFEKEGDFYDLQKRCYVSREDYIEDDRFSVLFLIQLLQIIDISESEVKVFFDFQLYDNFYGDRDIYVSFLQELPTFAKDCRQLPVIVKIIEEYIPENYQKTLQHLSEKKLAELESEQSIKSENWQIYLKQKRGFAIPYSWTSDEMLRFFSFLYDRLASSNEALLSKEQFDIIFQNGLVIPKEENIAKFLLKKSNRSPKKLLDAAIYKFWYTHQTLGWQKQDLILFFAFYLKDYDRSLLSKEELSRVASNITSKLNSYTSKLNRYLP